MIGMALFAILMSVNFTSCSSDDDGNDNDRYAEMLIGNWELVNEEYTGGLIFRNDGTGTHIEDVYSEPFTWELLGNTIIFSSYEDDGTKCDWEQTINELTATNLLLFAYDDGDSWTKTYIRK